MDTESVVKPTRDKATQSQTLVMLADGVELWKSSDGTGWATVQVGDHLENWQCGSHQFRRWLISRYWEAKSDAPNDTSLKSAIGIIEYKASKGTEHKVYLRGARLSDRIVIDLGQPYWNAVEVSGEGWKVVERPSVKFRRTKNMGAMPLPVPGGSVELLRSVISTTNYTWQLVLGFLLDAMKGQALNGEESFFLMSAHGEQGSAKSTLCRILRRMVDPLTKGELSGLPRDVQALAVDGMSEYMLSYDNVSHLPLWLSDALCRVATGGGLKNRKLYSDDEQAVLDSCAPVILNGIPDFTEANDLLRRTLLVRLPRISDEDRREEAEVFAKFEQIRPLVFGALLDMLSRGLANLSLTKIASLPSMADSCKWIVACQGSTQFLDAYRCNIEEASEVGFEASPIAELIVAFVKTEKGSWKGTASDLLSKLKSPDMADYHDRIQHRGFPQSAKALSERLKRDAPVLRAKGVNCDRGSSNGERWVSLSIDGKPDGGSDGGLRPGESEGLTQSSSHQSSFDSDASDAPVTHEKQSCVTVKSLENKAEMTVSDASDADFLLFSIKEKENNNICVKPTLPLPTPHLESSCNPASLASLTEGNALNSSGLAVTHGDILCVTGASLSSSCDPVQSANGEQTKGLLTKHTLGGGTAGRQEGEKCDSLIPSPSGSVASPVTAKISKNGIVLNDEENKCVQPSPSTAKPLPHPDQEFTFDEFAEQLLCSCPNYQPRAEPKPEPNPEPTPRPLPQPKPVTKKQRKEPPPLSPEARQALEALFNRSSQP